MTEPVTNPEIPAKKCNKKRNAAVRFSYIILGAAIASVGAVIPALQVVLVPIGIGIAAVGLPTPGVKKD